MVEVEAKVRLNGKDFERLAYEIPRFAQFLGESLKIDRYYKSGGCRLRVREENGGAVITFKSRERKQGIETNLETEAQIDHPRLWDRFLRKNGFPLIASKEKKCLAYLYDHFKIELNNVKRLGCFLEIERLVEAKTEVSEAKRGLLALFRKLGFGPKDLERKSYLELLGKKRKNGKESK